MPEDWALVSLEDKLSDENLQVEPVEQVEQSSVQEEQPKSFDEAYVKKLREEAAGYRVKLKEYEDRDKSEAEKQAERIAELEKENKAFKHRAQVEAWASEIVKGSHIPVSALRGDSEEDLKAHFELLKSLIPADGGAPNQVVPIDLSNNSTPLNSDRLEEAVRGALGI